MAKTTDIPVSDSVIVIGPQFISPNPLEIKIETYVVGKLVITDINNKILLKVKPCDTTFHTQRWILDANDIPIVKIREKGLSAHSRWSVFRGQSQDEEEIIFTTRNNHMIQFKTCINVHLGSKKGCKDDYNFQIEGKWFKKDLSISKRNYSTKIAQMNIVKPMENMKVEKDNFMVKINPGVDYAFVVALIAIVDAMNNIPDQKKGNNSHGVGGMIDIVGAVASS